MNNIFSKQLFKTILVISFIVLLALTVILFSSNGIANRRLSSCVKDTNNNTDYYKKELDNKDTLIAELEQAESTTFEKEKNKESTSRIFGGTYKNEDYNFSFSYHDNWYLQKEESSAGSDLHRIYLSMPGFIEEAIPNAEHILSISVSPFSFDKNYELLNYNVSKENEEKIIVSGRESIKRIGKHEFGGYLVVVIIPNGDNSIMMSLRTNDNTFVSQFQTILDSFKFEKSIIDDSTNLNKDKEIKLNIIEFPIKDMDMKFMFNEINCAGLSYYNPDFLLPVINYCTQEFNDHIISKDNFSLNIEKINKINFLEIGRSAENDELLFMPPPELKFLKSRHSDVSDDKLEEYITKYTNYIDSLDKAYKASIYLKGDFDDTVDDNLDRGSNEKDKLRAITTRITTKNTLGLTKDELKFWNYCEAGCPLWPIDIIDDYIIWEYNLVPCSGAACICGWGNETNYEDERQTRCELILGTRRNHDFELLKN